MSPVRTIHLPLEIHGDFIQLLGNDIADLCRLALVSQSFHKLANRALYRNIEADMTTPRGETRLRRLDRSLRGNPTLGGLVRKITIYRGREEQQRRRMIREGILDSPLNSNRGPIAELGLCPEHTWQDPFGIEDDIVPSVISHCKTLETLELTSHSGLISPGDMSWNLFRRGFHEALVRMARLTSLGTVRMMGVKEIPKAWVRLLGAGRTEFRGCNVTDEGPWVESTLLTELAADSKRLDHGSEEVRYIAILSSPLKCKTFLSERPYACLQTLAYDVTFKEDIPLLQNILNVTKDSLRSLIISSWRIFTPSSHAEPTLSLVRHPDWSWSREGRLDVSELVDLQSISLAVKGYCTSTEFGTCEYSDELGWALDIFRDLPVGRLNEVTVSVAWSEACARRSYWRPQMWKDWDQILSRHLSDNLNSVHILLYDPPISMEDDSGLSGVEAVLDSIHSTVLPTINQWPGLLVVETNTIRTL